MRAPIRLLGAWNRGIGDGGLLEVVAQPNERPQEPGAQLITFSMTRNGERMWVTLDDKDARELGLILASL